MRDVGGQLGLDDLEVGEGVATRLQGGAVDDVDEDVAALDVPQELQPEALALAGTRDEPGHVGDREALATGGDDTEVGHQRGEGVVSDLGLGRRHDADEGGLAGRGEADEGDVGERLELEDHLALLAGLAEQREAGGLAAR